MARAWLVAPLLGICMASLAVLIIRLAGLPDRKLLASAPLSPEQTIEIRVAGPVQLHLVGPRLPRAFGELRFSLLDPESGRELLARPILFRIRGSGRRDASLALQEFEVPRPGAYLLRAEGIAAGAANEGFRVKLREPYLAELSAYVVGIILMAGAALAIVVSLFLRSGVKALFFVGAPAVLAAFGLAARAGAPGRSPLANARQGLTASNGACGFAETRFSRTRLEATVSFAIGGEAMAESDCRATVASR